MADVTSKLLRAAMLREIRYTSTLRAVDDELRGIESALNAEAKQCIQSVHRQIAQALDASSTTHFEHVFEAMHGGYLQRLAADFPDLTPTELRLCALLRLPMPSKEVAQLLSCSVRSIEKHRERMRKKFGLRPADNLTTFLAARA